MANEMAVAQEEQAGAGENVSTSEKEQIPDLFDKGSLVKRVEALLLKGDEMKKKWSSFCNSLSAHSHAAKRQSEAFLMTFLDALEFEEIPEFQGTLPRELMAPQRGVRGGAKGAQGGGAKGKGPDSWEAEAAQQGAGKDAGGAGGGKGVEGGGKIFAGGLPKHCSEEAIAAYFSEYGVISEVLMKYDDATGSFRGFGFITFEDPSVAQKVVSDSLAGTTLFEGKWIDCKEAKAKGSGGGKGVGNDGKNSGGGGPAGSGSWDGGTGYGNAWDAGGGGGQRGSVGGTIWDVGGGGWGAGRDSGAGSAAAAASQRQSPEGPKDAGKVFVGGLPQSATEETISSFFSQWGPVKTILMKYTPEGGFRGFCFVVFEQEHVAQEVVAASQAGETNFDGKWIDCKEAVNRGGKDATDKGGKGGGKGGGKAIGGKGGGDAEGGGKGRGGWDGGTGGTGWGGGDWDHGARAAPY